MNQRIRFAIAIAIALVSTALVGFASAGEWLFGCSTRPACGKACKLVCGTKKIPATCYGCECKDICIPDRSQRGCKHCATCCGTYECEGDCPADSCCAACAESPGHGCSSCESMPPKCEFCWYDWFACGCARPRTVKVLTKYQAEKEIPWYHWEVVEAECCEEIASTPFTTNAAIASPKPPRIFKPAPAECKVGDTIELSTEEKDQLASWMTDNLDLAVPAKQAIALPTHATELPSAEAQAAAAVVPSRTIIPLPVEKDEPAPIAREFSDLFRLGD